MLGTGPKRIRIGRVLAPRTDAHATRVSGGSAKRPVASALGGEDHRMAFRKSKTSPVPECQFWRAGGWGTEKFGAAGEIGQVGVGDWGVVVVPPTRPSWVGFRWDHVDWFALTDSGTLALRVDDGNASRSPGRVFVSFVTMGSMLDAFGASRLIEARYGLSPDVLEPVPDPTFDHIEYARWTRVLAEHGVKESSIVE